MGNSFLLEDVMLFPDMTRTVKTFLSSHFLFHLTTSISMHCFFSLSIRILLFCKYFTESQIVRRWADYSPVHTAKSSLTQRIISITLESQPILTPFKYLFSIYNFQLLRTCLPQRNQKFRS